MTCLEIAADVSQVFTGIVALVSAVWFVSSRNQRRRQVEAYLRKAAINDAKKIKKGNGLRSVLHLMAKLGMTEEQLLQASFSSSHIRRVPKKGHNGLATAILFGYSEQKISN